MSSEGVLLRFDKEFALDAWRALFREADFNLWWEERHAVAALQYRFLVVTAWVEDRIVGTVTVESDGVNGALIDDVVVAPAYRGRGIGSVMVQAVVERLRPLGLQHVQLLPVWSS